MVWTLYVNKYNICKTISGNDYLTVTCSKLWEVIDLQCALVMAGRMSWFQAGNICDKRDGHLVTPKTQSYGAFIRNKMILRGKDPLFFPKTILFLYNQFIFLQIICQSGLSICAVYF